MQNLGFASAMLEQILAVFKTQYFHEKKQLEKNRNSNDIDNSEIIFFINSLKNFKQCLKKKIYIFLLRITQL